MLCPVGARRLIAPGGQDRPVPRRTRAADLGDGCGGCKESGSAAHLPVDGLMAVATGTMEVL
ncbi:hypothetical protein SBD_0237 [Streptomyces bottropensis ATCC 25435]|uniref:Uncharacterized protein n=1 Tax=Streptomyces bottropensis ATCC 25435 TaxID=1054862 RepID=M3FWY7_9ACTN|nr:hypothetical protein SBD_0237 [Streptomyces bottropensis ATCC 25435]